MKWVVWSMILAVSCSWAFNAVATAGEDPVVLKRCVKTCDKGVSVVFVADDADGEEGEQTFEVKLNVVIDDDGERHVVRSIGSGGDAFFIGQGGDRQPVSLVGLGEVDEDSGWLGIQLGSFRESEDGVDSSGIVILNVAKDSPAAVAGFEKDDVVIEVNDAVIADDMGAFVRSVGDASAGDRMKFTVMRDDARRTLVAVLGRRGDAGEVEWQYETDNSFVIKDAVQSRIKVLRRGDGNTWQLELIGEDDDLSVLPFGIGAMPRMHTRTVEVHAGDGPGAERRIVINVVRDGEGIAIETTDDGEIEVTRTSEGSDEETVRVYADAEELEAEDADAFELYNQMSNHMVIDIDADGLDGQAFTFRIDGEDGDFSWVEDIEDRLEAESGALAEALERLKDIHVQVGPDAAGGEGNTFFEFVHERATQTIRENPDGTIDVIVRKGDNELVTRYRDESDLQARNADAYETYLDLKSGGQ